MLSSHSNNRAAAWGCVGRDAARACASSAFISSMLIRCGSCLQGNRAAALVCERDCVRVRALTSPPVQKTCVCVYADTLPVSLPWCLQFFCSQKTFIFFCPIFSYYHNEKWVYSNQTLPWFNKHLVGVGVGVGVWVCVCVGGGCVCGCGCGGGGVNKKFWVMSQTNQLMTNCAKRYLKIQTKRQSVYLFMNIANGVTEIWYKTLKIKG